MASTTTRAVFWIVAMTVAVAADSVLHGRNIYRNENCTGTPLILSMANDSSCATTNCVKKKFGSDDYWVSNACNISDRFEYALDVFSQTDYVVLEIYTASGCETIHETFGLAPTGSCQVANNATTLSLIATRYSNESVSISYFAGGSCELDEFRKSYSATATSLNVSRVQALMQLRAVQALREATRSPAPLFLVKVQVVVSARGRS
ncbi:hypothetical protein PHYPSEUDO_011342 [Phytophthora pseudosyringae]|uniref:Uncharacterized protein n=1 Tax=Phytophthora pseudosyringae TaxID=221518 RepID=A0A8T1WAI2_9STRA|nr:hypothetical protein PHYPSEUDO_011342 [Phytophthora pseudosyringae]